MAREHKGKLALDSLLIMPVQRIPRYELLIKVNAYSYYMLEITLLIWQLCVGADAIEAYGEGSSGSRTAPGSTERSSRARRQD